jgi:hypothetical protein
MKIILPQNYLSLHAILGVGAGKRIKNGGRKYKNHAPYGAVEKLLSFIYAMRLRRN